MLESYKRNKVVALVGEAGAGKDSFFESASRLASRRGLELLNFKFAGPIHEAARAMCPEYTSYSTKDAVVDVHLGVDFLEWCREVAGVLNVCDVGLLNTVEAVFNNSNGITPLGGGHYTGTLRRFMEVLGTEVMREKFGEDSWVDILRSKLNELEYPHQGAVLTDTRFLNEFSVADGGVVLIIREDRPVLAPVSGLHESAQLAHSLTKMAWEYKTYGTESSVAGIQEVVRSGGSELILIVESYNQSGAIKFRPVWGTLHG